MYHDAAPAGASALHLWDRRQHRGKLKTLPFLLGLCLLPTVLHFTSPLESCFRQMATASDDLVWTGYDQDHLPNGDMLPAGRVGLRCAALWRHEGCAGAPPHQPGPRRRHRQPALPEVLRAAGPPGASPPQTPPLMTSQATNCAASASDTTSYDLSSHDLCGERSSVTAGKRPGHWSMRCQASASVALAPPCLLEVHCCILTPQRGSRPTRVCSLVPPYIHSVHCA